MDNIAKYLRRIFLIALVTLVLAITSATSAQIPAASSTFVIPVASLQLNEKDPGAVMTPVKKGQIVPYSGTLLSPTTVAILIAEFHALPKKCQIDVDAQVARCKADADLQLGMCKNSCDASTKILNSRIKMHEDIDAVNKKRIAELEKSQTNPLVWVLGGVVGGVVVTGLIVYVANR